MIKLNVVDFKGYEYTLKDNNNKIYILNLEFYNLQTPLSVNDTIYISDNLLNNKGKCYTFGIIGGESGKKNIDEKSEDIIGIKVANGNDIIYLQRYYG